MKSIFGRLLLLNTLLVLVRRGILTEKELTMAVNVAGETANARVILLDALTPEPATWQEATQDEWLTGILTRIRQGEIVVRRRQFATELGTDVVVVGIPSWTDGRVTGAIILFSPLNELEGVMTQARKVVLLSGSLLFLLVFVVIYFFSHRLTLPIVRMSRAAEAMAGGEEVADLEESRNDELGRLIISFNHLKNKLQKTEKMRRELIAGVSHELRSPLAAIKGFVQGMLDDVIPPRERPKYLALVLQETNHLAAMTNDLLEMARLESGSIILQKENYDLCGVAREVAALFTPQAAAKDVELELSGCEQALLLYADRDRIRQVISNLLSNALKFTPAGGKVRINLFRGEHTLVFEVRDTGPGIPSQELPLVYEKFYRVEKSRGASSGGTGLGLSIAKSIVDLHAGQIVLESDGKGTVARVILPEG